MAAYSGKTDCTDTFCTRAQLRHPDGSVTEQCRDYHCTHCDGPSNCMAVCSAGCPGHVHEERALDAIAAEVRAKSAHQEPTSAQQSA